MVDRICSICRGGANINNLHPKTKCNLYQRVKEARDKERARKEAKKEEKKEDDVKGGAETRKKKEGKIKMKRSKGSGGKWFRK